MPCVTLVQSMVYLVCAMCGPWLIMGKNFRSLGYLVQAKNIALPVVTFFTRDIQGNTRDHKEHTRTTQGTRPMCRFRFATLGKIDRNTYSFFRANGLTSSISDAGVSSFVPEFIQYLKDEKSYPGTPIADEDQYLMYLSEFLHGPGVQWTRSFRFDGNLTCGEKAPKVKAMTFDYMHKNYMDSSAKMIEAMDAMVDKVISHRGKVVSPDNLEHCDLEKDQINVYDFRESPETRGCSPIRRATRTT